MSQKKFFQYAFTIVRAFRVSHSLLLHGKIFFFGKKRFCFFYVFNCKFQKKKLIFCVQSSQVEFTALHITSKIINVEEKVA